MNEKDEGGQRYERGPTKGGAQRCFGGEKKVEVRFEHIWWWLFCNELLEFHVVVCLCWKEVLS